MTPVQTPPPVALTPSVAPSLTLDEFLIRYGDDRVDVIDGVVMELPMPKIPHAVAMNRMGRFLDEYAEVHRPGVVGSGDVFVLIRNDPLRVRGADVAYWSREKYPGGVQANGMIDGPPDLCVEVVSPTNTWNEVFTKVGEYLSIGVAAVVVLAPDSRTASVYRDREGAPQEIFHNDDTLTLPDVLPGFAVPVRRFFE